MSGTPPEGGDTGGNPASSSSNTIINSSVPQQQRLQPLPPQQILPQQLHTGSGSSPSSTVHNRAPAQPLFLKPHPTILPTYSGASNSIAPTPVIGSMIKSSTAKAPLTSTTTTSTAGALPTTTTPAANTTAIATAPVISAPFNPHVARGQGVKEPLPTDVICGRGKMTASHPANRRFRELVDSHKASYQNSKRRDEKTRITCDLVDKLRAEGRFVLFDPVTKLWHEVSEEYAREKVSHSLRSRSSTEQRIANAASNSIKMLNNAVHPDANDSVVSIAPRGVNHLSSLAVPKTSKLSPNGDSNGSLSPNSKANTKSKQQQPPSGNNKKTATLANKKKTKGSTAHKGSSSSGRSKHSNLKPGLDEIVKRLIKDQQKLLRMMIQKETDRFTSAAAMGGGSQPPRPPMPLSYKAEASAVSKLTASLPKLGGEELEGELNSAKGNNLAPASTPAGAAPGQPVSVVAGVAAGTSSDAQNAGPKDETHSSTMSTTVTA